MRMTSSGTCSALAGAALLVLGLQLVFLFSSGALAFGDDASPSGGAAGSESLRQILLTEVKERLDRLEETSDVKGSIQRTFLSPALLRAGRLIDSWMQEAGMRTWTDDVGNVHGRVDGKNPSAPALLLGSHYDTVLDAGKYDGLLGIVCAIAAVKAYLKTDGAQHLQRPVEVVAFSDEEGVRFQTTFLGSSAITGTLPPEALHATDAKGVSFSAALEALGHDSSPEGLAALKYDPRKVWAYVEAHIEQGPVLEDEDLPLGVVPAIAGQTRLKVSMAGEQGHAGTVPMRMRKDCMAAAAAAIVGIEDLCKPPPVDPDTAVEADPTGLVCTVGQLDVWPGASNVIPGRVSFSMDIRARRDDLRQETVKNLTEQIQSICDKRGLQCSIEQKHQANAVECAPQLVELLEGVVRTTMVQLSGADQCSLEGSAGNAVCSGEAAKLKVPRIVSGAGHDAMAMARLTKVAMLFVRCRGGVSHRPDEFVADDDLLAASAALLSLLRSKSVSVEG